MSDSRFSDVDLAVARELVDAWVAGTACTCVHDHSRCLYYGCHFGQLHSRRLLDENIAIALAAARRHA